MATETPADKRWTMMLLALHVVGLAVMLGACISAKPPASGAGDSTTGSAVAAATFHNQIQHNHSGRQLKRN